MRLRGEVCQGAGTLLSLATLILLIFTHVGQINTSSVPRGIYMAKLNVSQYGQALQTALLDPIFGLYTTNFSEPLLQSQGLRQYYEFGLYAHCGYNESSVGLCSNHSAAYQYRPYAIMTGDMRANYSTITQALVEGTSFSDSTDLGKSTNGAYYTILLGTIFSFLALVTGVTKHNVFFVISTTFACLTSIFVLCGAAIWTVMINKSSDINDVMVGDTTPVDIGIDVSIGSGLYLLWAAFACSFASLIPYFISCCTYRG
ncbi:actin cortical patch SUR7/pH-response regulator pali [Mucidula mucida]|nr:actin cortical patch SUR7/pH-response regulator pali [Mucidula mucida]